MAGLGGVLSGCDGDGEAEGLKLADVVADLSFGAGAVVVVAGAEVVEPGSRVGEQVEDDDEDRAGDGGLGFSRKTLQVDAAFDDKISRTAVDAARRKFSPEFMNRIDKSVVFRTLRSEHLQQILEIELGMVQQRVLDAGRGQFLFRVTSPARPSTSR